MSHTARDITIINLDKFEWTDVAITLNEGGIFSPGYSYKIAKISVAQPDPDCQTPPLCPPKGRTIPLSEFVQPNGARFDPAKTAIVHVKISWKVPKSLSNWFGWGAWEGTPAVDQ
jgi:hypothetical protein